MATPVEAAAADPVAPAAASEDTAAALDEDTVAPAALAAATENTSTTVEEAPAAPAAPAVASEDAPTAVEEVIDAPGAPAAGAAAASALAAVAAAGQTIASGRSPVDLAVESDVEMLSSSSLQRAPDEALARQLALELNGPASHPEEDEALARQLSLELNAEASHPEEGDEALALELSLEVNAPVSHPEDEALARSVAEADDQSQHALLEQATVLVCESPDRKKRAGCRDRAMQIKGPGTFALDPALVLSRPQEAGLPQQTLRELEELWSQWLRGERVHEDEVEVLPVSRNYLIHAVHKLLMEFPRTSAQAVRKAFAETGTYTEAKELLEKNGETEMLRSKRQSRSAPPCPMPKALSKELKDRSVVKPARYYLKQRQIEHVARVEQLRVVGGLGTCGCCFDEELLPEHELRCTAAEGHAFCIPCVKNAAVSFFGSGLFALNLSQGSSSSGASSCSSHPVAGFAGTAQATLRCMHTSGCDGCFTDAALQKALPVNVYARHSRRSAALNAASSGLNGIVSCPSCDYMVQMTDPAQSVIECLDPECGKVTCRWCHEDDHRPLRCDEVEKDGDVRIRTFLEERMAEASLPRCPNPNCKKPYEKTEGCNHMKCPCGTHSCYLCGKEIDKKRPYDHFKDGHQGGGTNAKYSTCTVYGTPAWAKKSYAEVRAEADAALEKYLAQNPDLQGIMQDRRGVQKRALSHLECSPVGKRHKSNK